MDDAEMRQSSEPAAPCSVHAQAISKRFGNRAILRSLNLTITGAQRVVLFGPNGAGKTTLLRILSTLSRPTAGRLELNGLDTAAHAQAARSGVGVVGHQTFLYDDLTASENLQFYGRMYDVPDLRSRIDEVLFMVGLIARRDDRVRTFSRGMQQRLAIARAILHSPSLLLFDEPDTGLDREGMALLERVLAFQVAANGSAILTTHDLRFGLDVADRVLLMEDGRLTLDVPAAAVDEVELDRRLAKR